MLNSSLKRAAAACICSGKGLSLGSASKGCFEPQLSLFFVPTGRPTAKLLLCFVQSSLLNQSPVSRVIHGAYSFMHRKQLTFVAFQVATPMSDKTSERIRLVGQQVFNALGSTVRHAFKVAKTPMKGLTASLPKQFTRYPLSLAHKAEQQFVCLTQKGSPEL